MRGKVLKVLPKKGKLVVEGVNRVYKHMKRSQKNPQGGRLSKEMPIDVSNVMLVDPQTEQTDARRRANRQRWQPERYAKASGASLGTITAIRKSNKK